MLFKNQARLGPTKSQEDAIVQGGKKTTEKACLLVLPDAITKVMGPNAY